MKIDLMTMPKHEAVKAWRSYRDAVKQRHSDEYVALTHGYKALAKGQAVLDLFSVMKAAGVDQLYRPRLAIANASAKHVYFRGSRDGGGIFNVKREFHREYKRQIVKLPPDTFPKNTVEWYQTEFRAVVPLIPAALHPQHALTNYHILWEAEWATVPRDPFLLRHLSGSLYAVLASWDLTPLEQAVLKGRLVR